MSMGVERALPEKSAVGVQGEIPPETCASRNENRTRSQAENWPMATLIWRNIRMSPLSPNGRITAYPYKFPLYSFRFGPRCDSFFIVGYLEASEQPPGGVAG